MDLLEEAQFLLRPALHSQIHGQFRLLLQPKTLAFNEFNREMTLTCTSGAALMGAGLTPMVPNSARLTINTRRIRTVPSRYAGSNYSLMFKHSAF